MDEARTKRITDHFDYMKARKKYALSLFNLFNGWRADFKAQQIDEEAKQRHQKAQELRDEAMRMQELVKEKHVAHLREQVRKAELEYKKAQLQLQRARRRHEQIQSRDQERAERYQRLLEASRNWIRQEDFEEHVNRAFDNPQPFGFITNLQSSKGF